jgi:DNA-binding XRE family transcriptional regulator
MSDGAFIVGVEPVQAGIDNAGVYRRWQAHVRNDGMAWKVIVVEPCLSWLQEIQQADRATLIQISQATTALAEQGLRLGRPLVDAVSWSRLPNLRELRPGSAGSSEVRLLFIFDPYRHTVFLVAGDTSGKWPDWHKTAIPQAEEAYAGYLRSARNKLSHPPLNGPDSRSWDDLVEEFDFSPAERRQIRDGADQMIAEVRARRLAEIRKRQNATQVEVAGAMGASQALVSRIEKGQLERGEVETLAAYVKALGGKLKIVADFGDESYVLG